MNSERNERDEHVLIPMLSHLHFKSFKMLSFKLVNSHKIQDRTSAWIWIFENVMAQIFKLHFVRVHVCIRVFVAMPKRTFSRVPNTYFPCRCHIQSTFTIFIRNDKSVREKWNIHKTIKFIANQIYIHIYIISKCVGYFSGFAVKLYKRFPVPQSISSP